MKFGNISGFLSSKNYQIFFISLPVNHKNVRQNKTKFIMPIYKDIHMYTVCPEDQIAMHN